MDILDTHQHLLLTERFRYSWCDELPALAGRRCGLEEYRAAAQGLGITRTLFMESGVDEAFTAAETAHVLGLAGQPTSGIVGVLGTARPEQPDFPAHLEAMLHPKLKGLRRILHVVPDSVAQTPCFAPHVALLARHNLTFDLCLLPRQLGLGAALARKVPDVQFILDHCGVPDIAGGDAAAWRAAVQEVARLPNVACKISGIVAYCDPARVTVEAVRPYVEHVVACFGWDRIVFGSDWPVCNLTSSLAAWVGIARALFAEESAERQAKFFAGNAERLYRVPSSTGG